MFLAVVLRGKFESGVAPQERVELARPGEKEQSVAMSTHRKESWLEPVLWGEVIFFLSVGSELRAEKCGWWTDCDLPKQEGMEGAPRALMSSWLGAGR